MSEIRRKADARLGPKSALFGASGDDLGIPPLIRQNALDFSAATSIAVRAGRRRRARLAGQAGLVSVQADAWCIRRTGVHAMPTKTKATLPTQDRVLATAAARRYGHVLPLPDGAEPTAAKAAKLLRSLLAAGLIEEHPTSSGKAAWRSDAQGKHTLLRITEAGQQAIAASQDAEAPSAQPELPEPPAPTRADEPRAPGGKLGQVLAAVRTAEGASLGDLVALTGWQPHTVRASLTRLRQGGVPIALTQSDGQKRYAATAVSVAAE